MFFPKSSLSLICKFQYGRNIYTSFHGLPSPKVERINLFSKDCHCHFQVLLSTKTLLFSDLQYKYHFLDASSLSIQTLLSAILGPDVPLLNDSNPIALKTVLAVLSERGFMLTCGIQSIISKNKFRIY